MQIDLPTKTTEFFYNFQSDLKLPQKANEMPVVLKVSAVLRLLANMYKYAEPKATDADVEDTLDLLKQLLTTETRS